jgi:CRP-like cAMP-binding protein
MNSYSEKSDVGMSSEFKENLEILRESYFFSGLPLEALKLFAYLCNREIFKQGDALFSQDDDDGQAFFILTGKVQLLHRDETGEHVIRDYEQGTFLGGLALLGNMRRLFSMKALTDVTCLIMKRDKFTKAIGQFPDLMPKIFKAVVESVRVWEERFLVERSEACEACRHKIGVSLV